MEIKRLDQELTVEIKRRTEMNKSTQAVWKSNNYHYNHLHDILNVLFVCVQWFEDHLDTMNRNFHDALEERDEKAHKKLEVLEERITALGEHFEEEKVTILKQIEERGQELARMLNEFKVRVYMHAVVVTIRIEYLISDYVSWCFVLVIYRKNLIETGSYD